MVSNHFFIIEDNCIRFSFHQEILYLFWIVRQRIETYRSFCGKQAKNVFVHRRDKLVVVAGVIQ